MDIAKARDYIFEKLINGLSPNLYYHSIDHVRDVLDAAIRIGRSEKISDADMTLLESAVVFHDSGFLHQAKNHEAIGCGIVREVLPGYGYNENEVEQICGMIMATKIPQSPRTELERIICDADLDYLGRDDYWKISNYLYKELDYINPLPAENWLRIQIGFLEQHNYFTATAMRERANKKNEHLANLKHQLKKNFPDSGSL